MQRLKKQPTMKITKPSEISVYGEDLKVTCHSQSQILIRADKIEVRNTIGHCLLMSVNPFNIHVVICDTSCMFHYLIVL